jgi:two-component system LytT family response regulator
MIPLRIAIVDDEPPARRRIRRLLERCPGTEIVGEAGSGAEAIRVLRDPLLDLVFLDIQMPDMDGFSVLRAIHRPPEMQVVFVTAFDQHALEAFEVHALDYLLKPVAPARFEQVVERVRKRRGMDDDRIGRLLRHLHSPVAKPPRVALNTGEKILFVDAAQIDFAESAGNYVLVHAAGTTHQIRSTLDAFAGQLDVEQFRRINRSQLVNMSRVRELRPWFHGDFRAILEDGTELNWSRRYSPKSHLTRAQAR